MFLLCICDSYSWHVLWTLIELYTKITKLFQNKGNHTKISMRWSLGRNCFLDSGLKGGLIVYFHVRSCSLSYNAVKSRTCFPKNMYDFSKKHVRCFSKMIIRLFKMLVSNYLCIHVICILIVWNSLINFLYLDIKNYLFDKYLYLMYLCNTRKTKSITIKK